MAEVGRAAVRDPGALLPGGFWAAVAVWLERPQVANKRLCGVRLEARRSVALPGTEARGPRPSAGPGQEPPAAAGRGSEEGPGLCQPSPEGGSDPRPSSGSEEAQGRRLQRESKREAAAAPPLAGAPGCSGEDDVPASDLDSLWDDFSRSLVGDHRDLLAFLTGSGAGLQPEAPRELDVVLRTVIPKGSAHFPGREIVVRDVLNGTVTFLPLEEDDKANLKVKMSNVYQVQLSRSKEECLGEGPSAQNGLGTGSVASDYLVIQRTHVRVVRVKACKEQNEAPGKAVEATSWLVSDAAERWHSDGVVYPKPAWLGQELLARLARWAVESRGSGFKSSLSLIPLLKYSRTYQALKDKYKDMVKVWPEVTDPEKFVYEDVAIAAYLLVLWEEERAAQGLVAKQSFVDLGCGNGLLVHILSREGHPGRGIDVRRRKIWDMYGPQTPLEEAAITPGDETLFPDADWLIGNHSDELTPWLPVIAARSSYRCRFFVLPCCFFDFVGRYRRRQSQKTQYREYLDFVQEVGSACGFHVEEDCLRIPSTKRVCLVGRSRTYPPSAEAPIDQRRTQLINRRRGCPGGPPVQGPAPAPPVQGPAPAPPVQGPAPAPPVQGPAPAPAPPEAVAGSMNRCPNGSPDGHGALGAGTEGRWLPGFHPRDRAERVRNCTALPREFIDQVVLQVASLLLGGKQFSAGRSHSGSSKTWNRGGSLSLEEVAGELDRETLQRLKRECGGLQTLLRTSHQVFRVLNGRVHIRDWREERLQEQQPEAKRRLNSEAFKTRLCWFFAHHPDGCALPADRCPFAHGPGELRPRPATKRKQQLPPPL